MFKFYLVSLYLFVDVMQRFFRSEERAQGRAHQVNLNCKLNLSSNITNDKMAAVGDVVTNSDLYLQKHSL